MAHARLPTRPSTAVIRVSFAINPGITGTQPAPEDYAALQNEYYPCAAPKTNRDGGWHRDNTVALGGLGPPRVRDQTSRFRRCIACRKSFDRRNSLDLEGRMRAVAARSGPIERSRGSPTAASENCALLHAAI
jgi:hypothetical protein